MPPSTANFRPLPISIFRFPQFSTPRLAPAGKHVMSIYMQFAPFHLKAGDWAQHSDALADTIVKTVAEYAPDLQSKILGGHIITPKDHGRNIRHNRRPPLPRRTLPRPNFHHAPHSRLGPLRHPGKGPLPLQQRHPPRQRRHRSLRRQRRPRNPPRPQKVSHQKQPQSPN